MGAITQSTIRTSFVLGIRLLVQAGTLLLVARLLGSSDYGLFAGIAALAVLMGTFSTFGTHLVLLREVSKNPILYSRILSYAVPTTLIFGCGLFLLYMVICLLLYYSLYPSLIVIICIGITEIILLPLFVLSTIEELALGKTAQSQLLVIFPLALRTLSAGLVLFVDKSEPLILFALLYLGSALIALYCRKLFKPNAWLSLKDWRLANRQELKNSASYAALALTAAGPSEIDKILATKLLPLGVGGVYVVAFRIIGAAILPVVALLLSAMPRLFRREKQSIKLILWILNIVLVFCLILTIILYLLAPFFEHLFGNNYQGLTEMVKWGCLSICGLALRIATGSILMTLDLPWIRAIFEFIGMIFLIILSIIFVRFLGVYGLPLAIACTEWLMAIFGIIVIIRVNLKTK